jgi:hypothetical protein
VQRPTGRFPVLDTGTNLVVKAYRRRFERRETFMKTAKMMLAGFAALTALSSASLAQQGLTGTVTRIDRLDGTVSIQLQKPQTEGGTVGANSGAPEELKTKVQGNLLNTLHAGDRVKFSIADTGGGKTITNLERQ